MDVIEKHFLEMFSFEFGSKEKVLFLCETLDKAQKLEGQKREGAAVAA